MTPHFVAGHSVGEYAALTVGGWLDLDEATTIVALRAEAMARACLHNPGTMVACVGLDPAAADLACGGTDVVIANLNSANQCVLSGSLTGITRVGIRLEQAGGSLIPLDVAGAFHSPLMADARAELAPVIRDADLRRGHIPLISSVDGAVVDDVEAYRHLLLDQVTAPVRWTRVMGTLAAANGDEGIVEVGSGSVLRGLMKRFDRRRPVASCPTWQACSELTRIEAEQSA